MAHHGDAAPDQKIDGLSHLGAAFELDRGTPGFLQHPRRIAKRLRRRFLIGTKRHIDDHAAALRASHHGGTMRDHHVERDTKSRVEPVEHHAERIADNKDIDMGIQKRGHRSTVGG